MICYSFCRILRDKSYFCQNKLNNMKKKFDIETGAFKNDDNWGFKKDGEAERINNGGSGWHKDVIVSLLDTDWA